MHIFKNDCDNADGDYHEKILKLVKYTEQTRAKCS